MRELRRREEAEGWLRAGFCLSRTVAPSPAAFAEAGPWIVATQEEVAGLPPAGVIADVGRLLVGGPRDFRVTPAAPGERLRAILRVYEDQVLGRLSADRRLEAANDALARMPAAMQAKAVAITIGSLLQRTNFDAGASLNSGVVRSLVRGAPGDLVGKGWEDLRREGGPAAMLGDAYESLVRAVRHAKALLTDADVFALENLAVLQSLTQRLSVRHTVEVAEELERELPRRIKRGNREGRRVATRLEDEDQYPIGGFSSIATSGSIENLVTSELIYMDSPDDPPSPDGEAALPGVDLFDMRYVEGELLYYTRDESVFVRSHRDVTFVFPAALERARYKDPGVRWQRLVIAMGLVLALVRRLGEWLSEEGLFFRVVFVKDASGGAPLGPERALAELLLREWIEKGTAAVEDAASLEAVLQGASERARRAVCDVVLLDAAREAVPPADPRVRVGVVDLAGAIPCLRTGGSAERATGPEDDAGAAEPWAEWVETARALGRFLV